MTKYLVFNKDFYHEGNLVWEQGKEYKVTYDDVVRGSYLVDTEPRSGVMKSLEGELFTVVEREDI